MNRTIHMDIFDAASIDDAIRDLKDYARWVEERAREIARRLAAWGAPTVKLFYDIWPYEGEKNITVEVEERGENTFAIVASGHPVLILEFGAGVTYAGNDVHPQSAEFGFGVGTYPGQKHAFDPNGWSFDNGDGTRTHTYGNAPSRTMYNQAKLLRDRVEKVAREVFSA